MAYELIRDGKTTSISDSVAHRISGGRAIPDEGLTVPTKTHNIAEDNHQSQQGTAVVRPKR